MLRPRARSAGAGTERVLALSDGIFAVAMTLLILEIHPPDLPPGHSQAALLGALVHLWPRYLDYAVSFLVIGMYWFGHRHVFGWIVRADGGLVWLNVGFLMLVTFIPFATDVVGTFGDERVAVAFYAVTLAAVGFVWWALWIYAARGRRLVDPRLDPRLIRLNTLSALLAPILFLASIGLAFTSPALCELSWLLIALVRPALTRLLAVRSHRADEQVAGAAPRGATRSRRRIALRTRASLPDRMT
jgi:uncharacterized membrane protein